MSSRACDTGISLRHHHNRIDVHSQFQVEKISKDPVTRDILCRIFKSSEISPLWCSINKKLTFQAQVIPLDSSQCHERYHSKSSMEPVIIDGKLSSIKIYYDREMNEESATLSLIVEIVNSSLVQQYLDVFRSVSQRKINTKEEFAIKMETLRWEAIKASVPYIKQLGLKEALKKRWSSYKDLNLFIEDQKKNGHMAPYEDTFSAFCKRQRVGSSSKKIEVDEKKISNDPNTQKILKSIFASEKLLFHFTEISKRYDFPLRVIPKSMADCINNFGSHSAMKPRIIHQKIVSIRIFYNKEMTFNFTKVAIIIEIMNAFLAEQYQNISKSLQNGQIKSKEEYATTIEKLEWLALNMSLPIINDLGLKDEIKDELDQFENLKIYLERQRFSGHTQIYEEHFTAYQSAR